MGLSDTLGVSEFTYDRLGKKTFINSQGRDFVTPQTILDLSYIVMHLSQITF